MILEADFTKPDLYAENEDGYKAFDLLRIRNGSNWEGYCQSGSVWTFWDAEDQEEKLENELEAIYAL